VQRYLRPGPPPRRPRDLTDYSRTESGYVQTVTPTAAPNELATFLVERYWPGVTADEVRATGVRLQEVVEVLDREGTHLRYLSSTLIEQEESVFMVFHGRSAEDVAEVSRRSGVPFDRILLATEITPRMGPTGRPGNGVFR